MNTRTWVTSDTHLGHRLMRDVRPFGDDHDAEIIRRWNDTVAPNDTVWHLGDLVINRSALPLVMQLHGRIRLVLGNHDLLRADEYLTVGIATLHGAAVKGDVLLTHVPVHPCQIGRFKGNVHGHMHDHVVRLQHRAMIDPQAVPMPPDPRYRCVSLEQTDYRPVLLSGLLTGWP